MRGFAGLDRPLDRSQHGGREDAPHPPAMLEKMLADALDAHNPIAPDSGQPYQLPDAPPPPKLPPPPLNPPLSLELPPPEDPPRMNHWTRRTIRLFRAELLR